MQRHGKINAPEQATIVLCTRPVNAFMTDAPVWVARPRAQKLTSPVLWRKRNKPDDEIQLGYAPWTNTLAVGMSVTPIADKYCGQAQLARRNRTNV
jgi:hypothetical protein